MWDWQTNDFLCCFSNLYIMELLPLDQCTVLSPLNFALFWAMFGWEKSPGLSSTTILSPAACFWSQTEGHEALSGESVVIMLGQNVNWISGLECASPVFFGPPPHPSVSQLQWVVEEKQTWGGSLWLSLFASAVKMTFQSLIAELGQHIEAWEKLFSLTTIYYDCLRLWLLMKCSCSWKDCYRIQRRKREKIMQVFSWISFIYRCC